MRRRIMILFACLLSAGCSTQLFFLHWGPTAEVRLDTLTQKRAAFAQAYVRYRRGDLEWARPMFERLATSYPELGDYHLYYGGLSAVRSGHVEDAEDAFRRLLNEYWDSVHVPAAKLQLGRLLVADGRDEEARALAEGILGVSDAGTVQGAHLLLGEIAERAGDVRGAYASFMRARCDPVGSKAARTAKTHVLALREQHPELGPAGADLLDEARLLLAERDYVAAEAAAARLVAQSDGVDPAEALRVRADALYGRGKLTAALTGLWDLADQYPVSPAASSALFRMATILWNRDRDTAALRAFQELRKRYPRHGRAAEALYAIGRIHQTAGRTADALAAFAAVVRTYPRSEVAADSQWRIGWLHYRDRNWSAAIITFARLARAHPSQRDGAQYWQARALEHTGRATQARRLYREIARRTPSGYYAMWAQRRLGQAPGWLVAFTTAVAAPEPPPLGPAPPVGSFHLARAAELRAAGVYGLARTEFAALQRQYADDPIMMRYLVRAYQTVDGYAAALRLVRRMGSAANLSAAERERLQYPLAFWTFVRRDADANALDPLLLVALMRQESLFDPAARSPADARGLMQLLPATARRVAPAGSPAIEPADLNDPELNIELGARYLRALFDTFRGDPIKAIAAYNSGEPAVVKWIQRFGALDADEFVESITYRETRDYVKKVLANYRAYQQLYREAS